LRILLIGPTAVGKTATSLKLAKALNAEIISADSRQCYKYLDIGTAKPTPNDLDQVRHYNISLFKPDHRDSAADFYKRAKRWEEDITSRGKNVMYVGGSTLHLQSIIHPFDDIPDSNEENLQMLEQQADEKGLETLYEKLEEVDPDYASKMDGLNRQRILRALDVWMQTGKPFSSFHTQPDEIELPEHTWVIGLRRNRKILYERINRRAELMLKKGLIEEIRNILGMGYNKDIQALKTVGYRQGIDFVQGRISFDTMVKDIKTKTRHYAKRQLTWFRRWNFVEWINVDGKRSNEIAEKIEQYLAANKNKD